MGLFDNETNWKHELKAEVGDTIRAYDWQPMPDRGDSYIEGVVTGKGECRYYPAGSFVLQPEWQDKLSYVVYHGYHFTATKRVLGGELEDPTGYPDDEYTTAFNQGNRDWENRIVKGG